MGRPKGSKNKTKSNDKNSPEKVKYKISCAHSSI